MPASDAKTMFLKASINHLDTIDTLVILWQNFLPQKNKTNQEKLNILTKQTPKDDDLIPQDPEVTEENTNDTEDIKHGTKIPPQH